MGCWKVFYRYRNSESGFKIFYRIKLRIASSPIIFCAARLACFLFLFFFLFFFFLAGGGGGGDVLNFCLYAFLRV